MITPIRAMRVDDIIKRKDDLLVSADDIKQLARYERNNGIDDLVNGLRGEFEQDAIIHVLSVAGRIKEQMGE